MLTQIQLDELKLRATRLLRLRELERQPWELAWSGMYPKEPTKVDIYEEWLVLKAKTERILSGQFDWNEEYRDITEIVRMIALADCLTFDITGRDITPIYPDS